MFRGLVEIHINVINGSQLAVAIAETEAEESCGTVLY